MKLRYLSVCSGIEAATQAWKPLGWDPVAFSEIEPFPSAVLAHHYPDVPNWGDMTKFKEWPDANVDVLCGGTPCQSFSVAGLRAGLSDPRGNLMLTYLAIAARYSPDWLVWENVPGVLSSNGGRDFGTLLRGMGELGYGFAYRVLDAQFTRTRRFPWAVPQRRRRVFVVGYLGDWRRAAAVLFDGESLSGNPPPRRETRQRPAPTISAPPTGGGGLGTDFDCDRGLIASHDVAQPLLAKSNSSHRADAESYIAAPVAPTLNAHFGDKMSLENQHINEGGGCSSPPVANPLTARMHKGINTTLDEGQTLIANGGVFDVPHSLRGEGISAPLRSMSHDGSHANAGGHAAVAYGLATSVTPKFGHNVQPTMTVPSPSGGGQPPAVAFDMRGREGGAMPEGPHDTANMRAAEGGSSRSYVAQPWAVRRLTPRECERVMGFPDDFTRIPYRGKPADKCPDGPRYKALGNSWAVNVAEWVGERIDRVAKGAAA